MIYFLLLFTSRLVVHTVVCDLECVRTLKSACRPSNCRGVVVRTKSGPTRAGFVTAFSGLLLPYKIIATFDFLIRLESVLERQITQPIAILYPVLNTADATPGSRASGHNSAVNDPPRLSQGVAPLTGVGGGDGNTVTSSVPRSFRIRCVRHNVASPVGATRNGIPRRRGTAGCAFYITYPHCLPQGLSRLPFHSYSKFAV